DDPHVDRLAPRAPEPPHGPLLDHLQQLGLEPFREEPDFIEEDQAAMGRLEESRLRLAGVGERAALVPEQLGLEERFRNRRAVDRHERAIGPRPDTVDQPGDEPLARARLAVEEDRGQMARTELAIEQTPDLFPDCLDAGALTDQFLQTRVQSSTTTTSRTTCRPGLRRLKVRNC